MAKYLSNRQQNLNIGIVSYTEDKTVLEVTGKVGIGTTNATSKLHVVGDARITGVVTATTFVGALTGTASSTTNIPNLTGAITSNNTTTSLGSFTSDQLSTALSDKTGTGVAVFATSPTLVTPVLGAATATSIVVSSGSTFTNGPILVGTATSTGTALQRLQVTGGAYVSGSVGIGTTNPTRTLDVNGDIRVRGGLYDVNNQSGTSGQLLVSTETGVDWQDADAISVIQTLLSTTLTGIGISEEGVGIGTAFTSFNFIGPGVTASANGTSVNVTVADYVSNAGIAASATQLVTPRTFQITGDVIASPISFDGTGNVSLAATIQPNSVGLGTDTTGDYVRDITGTANQITVTGGTGEGSTPILSIPSQFTAPQDVTVTRDLLVNRNLNVNGNITLGGTTAFLNVQVLKIADSNIILGVRTDGSDNDISNDTTANHGGIAVASTEGNPLVQLVVAGIETLPPTYKKIMWFKAGSFSGLGTDAWLINYAVGIGSTQFPTGTRLAAGNVQFTQNDLAVVRNINSSGIVTATTFVGALTGTATSTTNIPNLTGAITSNNTTTSLGSFSSANLATALTDETGSGSAVFATSPTLVTPVLGAATATSINVSGIATINQLDVNQLSPDGSNYGTVLYVPVANGSGGWNWATVASAGAGNLNGIDIREEGTIVGTAGSTTSIDFRGNNIIATGTAGGAIATVRVSDTPTFDSLVVSGVSTFTNGPILVGTATSTGTASQRLQVTGGAYVSGKLGIGVTNPVTGINLHTKYALIDEDGGYIGGQVYYDGGWRNSVSTLGGYAIRNTSGNFTVWTGSSSGASGTIIPVFNERLRIDGSGNVLIGSATSTGTASQRLQVDGGAYVSGNLGVGNTNGEGIKLFVSQGAPAANRPVALITDDGTIPTMTSGATLRISNDGSSNSFAGLEIESGAGRLVFTNAGNLGIGTTNPGATLNVVPTSTSIAGLFSGTTSSDMVRITQLGSGNALVVEDTANPDATPFVVKGDGAVGIGTTNPTQSLEVVGRAVIGGTGASDALYIRRVTDNTVGVTFGYSLTNSNTELRLGHNSGSGNFTIHLNGTGGEQGNGFNEKFKFTSAAQLGIGRSNPSAELDVFGGANFTNRVLIGSATSTGTASQPLQVTGGAYVSGNLGIGTTNPTSKLHVVGDVRVTGVVTATSFVGALTGTATSTTNIPNLTGAITSNNTTTSLGSFSSANLSAALTDKTGTGSAVFATSPTLVTPVLGAASATSINSSGIITATQFVTGTSGSAIGINTNTISGPATITIDPAAVGDNTGLVVIKGDLQIDGTTTTINSTTVTVDDKNIVLGSGAINDAAADGSGITIESGNGNKTFQFEDTGDNLGSSENLNVASGKVYKINNTSVLSSTTLGSGVVNSSLTSVGTLGQLQVTGVSTFTNGPILVGTSVSTGTASQRLQVDGGAYVSGKVGVGVTNPAANTQVAIAGTLGISEVGGAGTRTLFTSSSSGFTLNHNDNSQITFQTLGVNRLTYSHSSNFWNIPSGTPFLVGTGTSTGTASQRLQVTGGAYVSGNLGVGATNPQNPLHISGSAGTLLRLDGGSGGTGTRDIFFSEFNTAAYGGIIRYDSAADLFTFGTVENSVVINAINVERTTGDVGIGTTTPTSKLHVSGDVTATTFVGALTGTATSTTNIPNLTGAITSVNTTTSLGSFSSANLATALTDETGTGSAVFATSPTLVTPVLGAASATSIVVSSGSTFTNGPILVGSATSTGTASQPLQVNGGAYVSGSVGIGTTNPTYKLHVNGSFGATTKSFVIPHPTKEGKKLQYGSLEGPENGVYIRGRTQEATIELPEYWTKLVDAESITVSLTPIGNSAMPRVEKVSDNTVYVFSKEEGEMDYYYTIFAERCDVAKLEVEF